MTNLRSACVMLGGVKAPLIAQIDSRYGRTFDDEIAVLLRSARTIAVVGAFANLARPSH